MIEIETRHSAIGEAPTGDDPGRSAYLARLIDWDARKAEALCMSSEDVPMLQRLRSLLFRGRMESSERMLRRVRPSDQQEASELLLEEARLRSFQGRWEDCAALCNRALEAGPAAISRLSILQVRSVAFFELGDFQKSLRDLEAVSSLSRIFPKSVLGRYGEILRIKILARTRDVATARGALGRLLSRELAAGTLDLDACTCFLRTLIDLNRLSGESTSQAALANYVLVDQMGNRLFRALARLDWCESFVSDQGSADRMQLRAEAEEFERVRRLMAELDSAASDSSTTGKTMLAARAHVAPARAHGLTALSLTDAHSQLSSMLWVSQGILIDLQPFSVRALTLSPRIKQGFSALSLVPISKAEFFRRVWGAQKYASHLHDDGIDNLLYRMRRVAGVEISAKGGMLALQSCLILGVSS